MATQFPSGDITSWKGLSGVGDGLLVFVGGTGVFVTVGVEVAVGVRVSVAVPVEASFGVEVTGLLGVSEGENMLTGRARSWPPQPTRNIKIKKTYNPIWNQ